MKTAFFFSFLLISLQVFAQDTYHSYESITCAKAENCLINPKSNFVIKGINLEDRKGEVVGMRLSSSSNIADTAYAGSVLCYQGQAEAVCGLMHMMSYDDGHAQISNFSCFIMDDKIQLGYDVEYDMGPGKESVKLSIAECE